MIPRPVKLPDPSPHRIPPRPIQRIRHQHRRNKIRRPQRHQPSHRPHRRPPVPRPSRPPALHRFLCTWLFHPLPMPQILPPVQPSQSPPENRSGPGPYHPEPLLESFFQRPSPLSLTSSHLRSPATRPRRSRSHSARSSRPHRARRKQAQKESQTCTSIPPASAARLPSSP